MSNLLLQLRAFHEQLDPQRRRVLYIALTLAIATVIGVGVWASQESMVEVGRPTTSDDLADASARLSQAGISYELNPQTRAILVTAADRVEAMRALTNDVTDDIEPSPFVTPDQAKFTRTLARQRELERTINGYDGVLTTKVNLNLPETSPFFKDDHVATASVMVRAEPGASLSPKLGRTIARTVSGANEGMSLYDVSVSDASGRELWPGEMDNDGSGNVAMQSSRRESELSRGVLSSLSAILGSADDLAVSVSVELDASSRHQEVKQLDPTSGVAIEETVKSLQTGSGATGPTGGVPGTDTNLPEATTRASAAPAGRTEDSTVTRFDYSNTRTETTTPAGGVRRLSASVLINSAAIARVLGVADGSPVDEKAAASLRADIEEATRASLGFDATRGDQVVIKFIPFAALPAEVVVEPSWVSQVEPYLPGVVALVAVLGVIFGVVRPLLRMVAPVKTETAVGELAPVMGPDGRMMPAANGPMHDEPTGETSLDLMERLRNYIENYQAVTPGDLSDLVRRETVHSAEVVRRWIRG